MYDKACKELDEINMFFNIRTAMDAKLVLTAPINRSIKKHDLRILYEELCYVCKLTYSEVQTYLSMLEGRLMELESAIDHHFELIKKTIYQDKADKIERMNKKYKEEEEKKSQSDKKS